MLFVHEIEICAKDKAKDKCVVIGKDLFDEALKIRQKMVERGDLRTRWWVRFIGAMFAPVSATGDASFTFTDIDGTSRTQYVKRNTGTTSTYDYIIFNTVYCSNRFIISVGGGTTPPTIDDYKLVSKIAEALPSHTLDDVSGIVTLTAGFTFLSDTVINEVGLEWECTVSGLTTCGRFLVDRTLLSSPFTAPAGVPITVTYRILV
jgi:hypothetical protein